MRRTFLVSALAVATLSTVVLSAPVQAQDSKVIVSVDGVIYENPDKSSQVILRVQAGEQLPMLSQQGDWVQVQLPRGKGWIMKAIVRGLSDSPTPEGIGGGGGDARVTVIAEFADVKAGPGEAYLAVRRVFKGDSFTVAKRSEDNEWVQLRVDGDLGWVRADQITASASPALPGGGGGGGMAGGGGGGGGGGGNLKVDDIDDINTGIGGELPGGESGPVALSLRVGGSFQLAEQNFTSDSASNPFVQTYSVDSALAGIDVGARAWFFDYVGAVVDYQLGIGTPIEAQFAADQPPQELSNDTHRLHVGATGRFPFSISGPNESWVGVTGGFVLHQFNIQPIQLDPSQPPIFVNNSYTGVRTAVEFGLAIGPLEVFGGGGLVLGGTLDQGQFTSGEQKAASYLTFEGGVGFELISDIGVFVRGSFDQYETDFAGPAGRQADISQAINRDIFISFSSGVTWRPL